MGIYNRPEWYGYNDSISWPQFKADNQESGRKVYMIRKALKGDNYWIGVKVAITPDVGKSYVTITGFLWAYDFRVNGTKNPNTFIKGWNAAGQQTLDVATRNQWWEYHTSVRRGYELAEGSFWIDQPSGAATTVRAYAAWNESVTYNGVFIPGSNVWIDSDVQGEVFTVPAVQPLKPNDIPWASVGGAFEPTSKMDFKWGLDGQSGSTKVRIELRAINDLRGGTVGEWQGIWDEIPCTDWVPHLDGTNHPGFILPFDWSNNNHGDRYEFRVRPYFTYSGTKYYATNYTYVPGSYKRWGLRPGKNYDPQNPPKAYLRTSAGGWTPVPSIVFKGSDGGWYWPT